MKNIDRDRSILIAALVVDTSKVAGLTMGALADYLALVSLSLVQSPDHCDRLPSILDLMAPSCSSRPAPTGITAADVAFLRAVYSTVANVQPTLSVDELGYHMRKELSAQ
jgi:hypothetical protein